ncbi:MAG TPA: lactate utilization protein [Candidatus Binataceae bacterium]|nr:lactate utilization protein [Candidatus Binataceae bacterium]
MSGLTRLIANVKTALAQTPHPLSTPPPASLHADPSPPMPIAPAMRRTELAAQFARELGKVEGDFIGTFTPDEARDRAVNLARQIGATRIAVGAGVVLDEGPIARALEHAGFAVSSYRHAAPDTAAGLADQMAQCDLGVVEADYAIASTGTFAVTGAAGRPLSLSLLPPVNLILVDAARLVPDLATAVSALGLATVTDHRIALITGPSRTADIEKMIVVGVHGPKQLYAMIVWPERR